MAKRILFVDDEPLMLSALERSLFLLRPEWEMSFVKGGQEALQAMGKQRYDVIVTDIRMPGMSGVQLLEKVKERYPDCLRFVLSGQADKQTILNTVSPAHQFLSKPCKAEELKRRLAGAFAVRTFMGKAGLREVVSKLGSLPSLPTLFVELTNEINSGDPRMARIANLVSRDMGMTAKILQLVNSSFFGLRTQVSSPSNAVQLLGLDILRALVLSTHVFSKFRTDILDEGDIAHLWEHSLAVAGYAKRIALMEMSAQPVVDDCFTAGLLHDVGKLVLASAARVKYADVLRVVRESEQSLGMAETEVLGCTHADVGAYLLGLWGLPDSIIEGVAFHHAPSDSFQEGFSPVAATHVASVYHRRQNPTWFQDKTELDVEYLRRIGCAEEEEKWRGVVEETAENGE